MSCSGWTKMIRYQHSGTKIATKVTRYTLMDWCRRQMTPLHQHWSYRSFAWPINMVWKCNWSWRAINIKVSIWVNAVNVNRNSFYYVIILQKQSHNNKSLLPTTENLQGIINQSAMLNSFTSCFNQILAAVQSMSMRYVTGTRPRCDPRTPIIQSLSGPNNLNTVMICKENACLIEYRQNYHFIMTHEESLGWSHWWHNAK